MPYKNLEQLRISYALKKQRIKDRLNYFKSIKKKDNNRFFAELCFCLLTPQSKAKLCDAAVQNLVKSNILYNGDEEQIKNYLAKVRFYNNKSRYIIEAREFFTENNELKIKEKIFKFAKSKDLREWLVKNIKGLGLKESSHFLRNIGFYRNLAILDRHILKNLQNYNVIKELPKSLSKKQYLEIEQKFLEFAKSIGISSEELDLLFWSEETGEIFK